MNILAVDSCSAAATGAVLCDNVLAAEFVINDKNTHSVKLLPQIESMMKSVGMSFADIDLYAVTTGPGSFTGQRIGVATVKALAHATGKPVVGVSSLKAMAHNISECDYLICPIMDARREQVYTASYLWEKGILTEKTADRAMALTELLDELNGKHVIFLGDGVTAHKDKIKSVMGELVHFAPPHLLHLRAGSVAVCADIKDAITYDKLVPSYLRLSQAEREYNDRIGK